MEEKRDHSSSEREDIEEDIAVDPELALALFLAETKECCGQIPNPHDMDDSVLDEILSWVLECEGEKPSQQKTETLVITVGEKKIEIQYPATLDEEDSKPDMSN
ncbi:hypothetical protein QAD02_022752 [Eretmocerus hayati]|uniref:Uncharacterized protein n=2 Tax=Eretmocerus hayati TaxID=131215 RepID=A0ACC2PV09_9HYME|nr:hypothetical protein QAD02_001607 [Eretmocerus hayati]KAJ8686958.1 hypothetical protein QAD02_022752 [Eretmocerus hayati]